MRLSVQKKEARQRRQLIGPARAHTAATCRTRSLSPPSRWSPYSSVGFVPQYVRASRLENELRQSRQENAGAQLRDLISLAYVQANQKNFGLGAETTSRFFTRVRKMANQTPDASSRKALEDLLALRDRVTAELAKGDTAAMADLQELFDKTRQATRSSREP